MWHNICAHYDLMGSTVPEFDDNSAYISKMSKSYASFHTCRSLLTLHIYTLCLNGFRSPRFRSRLCMHLEDQHLFYTPLFIHVGLFWQHVCVHYVFVWFSTSPKFDRTHSFRVSKLGMHLAYLCVFELTSSTHLE